jgi:hypothetical protein
MIRAIAGREFGKLDVAGWMRISKQGRWTYTEAINAVEAHLAESTDWLLPGHITQRIKSARQDKALRSSAPPPPRRLAIDGIYVNTDLDEGELHGPEVERLHIEACEAMPNCVRCSARNGDRCRNPKTDRLKKLPCLPRVTAARKAGWIPVLKAKCPSCNSSVSQANIPEAVQLGSGERRMAKFFCRSCSRSFIKELV